MLILLLTSAFSTAPTREEQLAEHVADAFMTGHGLPLNIGCDTDPVAAQIPEFKERWSPLCSHGTLTETSNMLVYNVYMLEDNPNADGADYAMREKERKFLSNPANVRATYRKLKPFVLGSMLLADRQKLVEIRTYLGLLIQDFTMTVPPELRKLWLAEAAADKAMMASSTFDGAMMHWNDADHAAYTAANAAFGTAAHAAWFTDPLALQWRLRREQEGGQALVDAYREIFTDFAKSI